MKRWQSIAALALGALLIAGLIGCASKGTYSGKEANAVSTNQSVNGSFDYHIRMYDAEVGWAYGQHPQNKSQYQLWMTTNRGESWENVMPEGEFPFDDQGEGSTSDARFAFFDPEHFWLIREKDGEEQVYRTANGGLDWDAGESISAAGPVVGFSFVDAAHGWLTVNTKMGLDYSMDEIYRTDDSGLHWQLQSSVEKGNLPQEGEKSAPIFLDDQRGFIGVSLVAEAPVIYQTMDGGRNWVKRQLPLALSPKASRMNTLPPQFMNSRDGVLPLYFESDNKVRLSFYTTNDGGDHWGPGEEIEAELEPFRLQYDFVSPLRGWLMINGSTLYVKDSEWKPVYKTENNQMIVQFDFVDEKDGWAIFKEGDNSVLMKTIDGGAHWMNADFRDQGTN